MKKIADSEVKKITSERSDVDCQAAISEAHARLADAALALRRRLTRQSPAARVAVKAEREAFRLKRELQRMDLEAPVQKREPLPEVRRGGKVIDVESLRRGKDRGATR